jgi:hypothetical protein
VGIWNIQCLAEIPHAIDVKEKPKTCINLRLTDVLEFTSWYGMVEHYMSMGFLKD